MLIISIVEVILIGVLVSSGFPAASLSSALSAHFCCPLAHHSRLHGQVHACWLQRPSGEMISDEHKAQNTPSRRATSDRF